MARADSHPRGQDIAAAARGLVGLGFRPQGRGPEGFDCLGVALVAAAAAGVKRDVPTFALKGLTATDGVAWLMACGCRQVPLATVRPGDLLLGSPAQGQVHLAVVTPVGWVEAHAGLRRVVERPRGHSEGWISGWRLPAGED